MSRRQFAVPALALAVLFCAVPAHAQYYGGPYRAPPSYDEDDEDDRPPPPRYDRRDYEGRGYERRGYGYERPYYRPRSGNLCVTSRGECPTPPLPYGAGCGCYIPGFGNKRGVVQ